MARRLGGSWATVPVVVLVVLAVVVPDRASGLDGFGAVEAVSVGGLSAQVPADVTGQPVSEPDVFGAVAAGGFHSCGLRTDGSVTCWGDNEYGQVEVPSGLFAGVSAGGHRHSCGVRTNGSVACWGWNRYGQTYAPSGAFSSVDAGYLHSCALSNGGSVRCWGDDRYGQTDAPVRNVRGSGGRLSAFVRAGRRRVGHLLG